jgi:hypothetical protein
MHLVGRYTALLLHAVPARQQRRLHVQLPEPLLLLLVLVLQIPLKPLLQLRVCVAGNHSTHFRHLQSSQAGTAAPTCTARTAA